MEIPTGHAGDRRHLDWDELHRIMDYASTLPEPKAEPPKETVAP